MFLMIVTIIVLNLIVIYMPKRISRIELYATSCFALLLQDEFDTLLGLKFELYQYFKKGPDIYSEIAILGIYPAINIIFLNFFPFSKTKVKKALYILAWSTFALFYEWVAEKTVFFKYTGWEIWYSIPFYPLLFIILWLNLKFVRWLIKSCDK